MNVVEIGAIIMVAIMVLVFGIAEYRAALRGETGEEVFLRIATSFCVLAVSPFIIIGAVMHGISRELFMIVFMSSLVASVAFTVCLVCAVLMQLIFTPLRRRAQRGE
ncbi:MAG: hypothetical protein ABIG71_01200 [Candidatus Uhrbacteria bacterium]